MTLLQLLECMNNPKITVVTVCYNAVDVIEKTILSVINQTYSNIEYIVIDGNSSDGTVNIIKKYADRISKWISEPDKGIYDAMNKGIDVATGEWINFMNAGDMFVNKHVIENLISPMKDGSDYVFGNTILENGGMTKIQKGGLNKNGFPDAGHQSSFVKTYLMKKYHFEIKYAICSDFDFVCKLYKNGIKFRYVDINISSYNMRGLSSDHRTLVYKEHCEIRNIPTSWYKIIKYRIEDAMPVWLMKRLLNLSWLVK